MTTGKTRALTRWTFVGKLMSLLFNMLSRLVIAFLLRSKHLLISWLQSPSAVILELPKIKSVTVSTVSPLICHEVLGPDATILSFPLYNRKEFDLGHSWILKNALCKSILLKNLLPGGMGFSDVLGLGTIKGWGTIMLFAAQRSWANLHFCPNFFSLMKWECSNYRDNGASSLYSSTMDFMPWRASIFIGH